MRPVPCNYNVIQQISALSRRCHRLAPLRYVFFVSFTSVVRYSRRRWSNGGKGTDARHFVKN